MFREKPQENFDGQEDSFTAAETTVLNQEAKFEGKLTFEGKVIINGDFSGDIISNGELIIGKNGSFQGNLHIGKVSIYGKVEGNIKAKQKIEINEPAIVRGDITAPSLTIEEGAVFEGNCSMGIAEKKVVQMTSHSHE